MCLKTRIEQEIAKKAAIDATIAKLEKIISQKTPVINLVRELLADISAEAPDELATVWQEILEIGSEYSLLVPVPTQELQEWEANMETALTATKVSLEYHKQEWQKQLEAVQSEHQALTQRLEDSERLRAIAILEIEELRSQLEKLKLPAEVWQQQLEENEAELTEQDKLCLELENQKLKAEIEELRSQIETERATRLELESDFENYKELWHGQLEVIQGQLRTEHVARLEAEKNLAEVRSQFEKYQANHNPIPSPNLTPEEQAQVTAKLADFAEEVKHQKVLNAVSTYSSIFALTLWQPWASLVAEEKKRIETRSWSTSYRGPIAIHAAKRPADWSTLNEDEYALPEGKEWPLGAVVAIANLVDCIEMTPEFIAAQTQEERALGLWQPGLFAWVLENVQPLDPPVPAKGRQGLWNWNGAVTKVVAEPEYEEVENLKTFGHSAQEVEHNDEECDPSPVTIKHRGKKWTIEILNFFATYVSFFLRTSDGGFTERITRKEWEESGYSLAECAKKILDDRVAEIVEAAPLAVDPETETRFKVHSYSVQVYPQYAGEDNAGATFRFLNDEAVLVFDRSLPQSEIGNRPYKTIAQELAQKYEEKKAAERDRIENPYKKPEDDFVQLIRLNPFVGYLKQKAGQDAGKILKTYVAFANKDENGDRTPTNSKSRAQKWREYFHSTFESCGWKVAEVRKVERMLGEPGKLEPKYEIPISGVSMAQIEKLAQENFSLLPGQLVAPTVTLPPVQQEKTHTHTVKVNGRWLASGTEEEMRSRFLEELKILGGATMSVALQTASEEVIESYSLDEFKFEPTSNCLPSNPEFEVVHSPTGFKDFTVWKKLSEGEVTATWRNSVYPYVYYTYREGAAVDAVRRLIGIQQAK